MQQAELSFIQSKKDTRATGYYIQQLFILGFYESPEVRCGGLSGSLRGELGIKALQFLGPLQFMCPEPDSDAGCVCFGSEFIKFLDLEQSFFLFAIPV